MSKILPDNQIFSLKAMRSGAIAAPPPVSLAVGVSKQVFAQPLLQISKSLTAVESLAAAPVPINESPVVGSAFAFTLSVDALQSKSLAAVESLEPLTAMPSESPTVGVALSTSVI